MLFRNLLLLLHLKNINFLKKKIIIMNKILKFKFFTKFSLDLFNNKKFVFINNIYLNKFSNDSIY